MMDAWHCFKYFTLLIFLYIVLLISYYPHFTNENKKKTSSNPEVYMCLYICAYIHTHIYMMHI